jgi:hypothetical protein
MHELVSFHPRHSGIRDDQVGALAASQFESTTAVSGFQQPMTVLL